MNSDYDDNVFYYLDPDSLAFQNPSNILTHKKADMITNEFIKPVDEKEQLKPVQVQHSLFEQISNSIILFIKDTSPLNECLYKHDLSYNFPRWVYMTIFLIFLSLLLYLIYGIIVFLSPKQDN